MHMLDLWYEGARRGNAGHLGFVLPEGGTRRWTFLPDDDAGEEILRLIALVCGGLPFLLQLGFRRGHLVRERKGFLRIEAILKLHAPRDQQQESQIALGLEVAGDGSARCLPTAERRLAPGAARWRRNLPVGGAGIRPCLHLAYGSAFHLRRSPVEHDFEDPWFRRQRFASLFLNTGTLTAPAAFLERIDYRCRKGRAPALELRVLLEQQLGTHLGLNLGTVRRIGDWKSAAPQERAATIFIDAARHLVDASPHDGRPLERAGILSLHRPEAWADGKTLTTFLELLDDTFPRVQFVVTTSRSSRGRCMNRLAAEQLDPPPDSPAPLAQQAKVPRGTVALVQVDGRLPNLALMKLARHFREHGRPLRLFRPRDLTPAHLDEVYASAILHTPATMCRVADLRRRHGSALTVGGSGVDLALRLPPDIEALPADYSIYPELDGIALGFLTRGCPGRCSFCIVPRKEGAVHRVTDLETLTEGGRRRRLILLDDNLLAHPDAEELLSEMLSRRLEVNFNQTLDILRVTPARARLMRRIKARNVRFTRDCLHFSLNDARRLEAVAKAYTLFAFTPADHVEFICMYGRDTTLAEDVERFRFLRALPGAYVFVQQYLPPLGATPVKAPPFFDARADRLLDELAGICFTENMKSMEKYYRWASEAYYQEFGRLHRRLVDTIFRYNHRDHKGLYLAAHPTVSRQAHMEISFDALEKAQPHGATDPGKCSRRIDKALPCRKNRSS